MADVFISYSQQDRGRVTLLADKLRAVGLDVWFDKRLTSGVSFDEEIARQLRAARVVVAAWTPRSIESEWVRSEAAMAHSAGKLAAAFLERTNLIPPFNLIHTEDLSDWNGEDDHAGWINLLAGVAVRVGRGDIASWGPLVQADDRGGLRAWASKAPSGPLRASTHYLLSSAGAHAVAAARKTSNGGRSGFGGALLGLVVVAAIGAGGYFAWRNWPAISAQITSPQAASVDAAPEAQAAPVELAPGAPRLEAMVEHSMDVPPGSAIDFDTGQVLTSVTPQADFIITDEGYWYIQQLSERAEMSIDIGGAPTRAVCESHEYNYRARLADPGEYNCFKTSEGRWGALMRDRDRPGLEGVAIRFVFWE